MNWQEPTLLHLAIALAALILSVAMPLALARLVRGPSIPDRVVALDLIAVMVVGTVATYSIAAHQPVLLDAAIVLALVAFLGTVAFAGYVERSGHDD